MTVYSVTLCAGGKILLEYRDGFKVINNVEGIEGILHVTVSQYKKRLLFNADEHVVLHQSSSRKVIKQHETLPLFCNSI